MHSQYTFYDRATIGFLPEFQQLAESLKQDVLAASVVLPFRVNAHVIHQLIDWKYVPNDPYFRLTFPRLEMLPLTFKNELMPLWNKPNDDPRLLATASLLRAGLNPYPDDQRTLNIPQIPGRIVTGIQHKYPSTVLFFPSGGQTCHAYCTYCFRWSQFVGDSTLRFADNDVELLSQYIKSQRGVTDLVFTGGDPLVMSAQLLRRYVQPLLSYEFDHLKTIRIGTKALSYWPTRFTSDPNSIDLLNLFSEITASGKHLAIMTHFTHPREVANSATRQAIAAILSTGAVIRAQEPIVKGVNDSAEIWANLWQSEIAAGIIPYYVFLLRDTGTKDYFRVSLANAVMIINEARKRLSGLAQTARGPIMSTSPGKIVVDGVSTIYGQKVFSLRFLQARNPDWVGRPFFAEYNEEVSWLNELRPAFGEREFFFEQEFKDVRSHSARLNLL